MGLSKLASNWRIKLNTWTVIGFIGQALFGSRFLV